MGQLLLSMDSAEASRIAEIRAVERIQSIWRGFIWRKELNNMVLAALMVQKWFKGYKDRIGLVQRKRERDRTERLAFFNAVATSVQRRFRGFWSRKHLHNFYARKAYLAQVMVATNRAKVEMEEEGRAQMQEEAKRRETAEKDRFEKTVGSLHHLLSTSSVRGIYRSQYMADGLGVTVGGANLEEYIKAHGNASSLGKYRSLPPIDKRGKGLGGPSGLKISQGFSSPTARLALGATASSSKRDLPPLLYRGVTGHLSVQAGAEFEAKKKIEREAKSIENILRISHEEWKPFSRTFSHARKVGERTLVTETPYELSDGFELSKQANRVSRKKMISGEWCGVVPSGHTFAEY